MESSNVESFDYLVIGAGSGGIASGRRAALLGKKVGIIEHKALGGTCVNVGCVPKKVMFNASTFVETCELMESYGITAKPTVDFATLKKNRDTYVKRLNGIYETNLGNDKITVIKGFGRFIDNRTVEVNGKKYTGEHILIAVGSKPNDVQFEGKEHTINSDGFFELDHLPKAATILGGGYIAVEIGLMLAGLGCPTKLIVRSKILAFLDDDVRMHLMGNLEKLHNFEIINTKGVEKIVKKENGMLDITSLDGKTWESEIFMQAAGRSPNIDELCLKNTSIKLNERSEIVVDEHENTTVDKVYSIGDVTGRL
jgi:glutathione reductase (NADPH)